MQKMWNYWNVYIKILKVFVMLTNVSKIYKKIKTAFYKDDFYYYKITFFLLCLT